MRAPKALSGPWTPLRLTLAGGSVFVVTVIVLFMLGRIGPAASLTIERDKQVGPALGPHIDEVVQYGQEEWTRLRASGADLSSGPCIDDGETFSGWAIDLVRGTRVDGLPENQCPTFNSGKSTKLIELSLEGDVVRAFPENLLSESSTESE